MEASYNETSGGIPHHEFRLSWVAYILPLIVFFVLCGLCVGLVTFNQPLGLIAIIATLLIFIYQVLYLRSTILFTDNNGVWVFRGVLPWNKGVTGVKWRDVEDAVFYTGFVSWAFNSYRVRIGNRFTKASELLIFNVKDGKAAVSHINQMHRARITQTVE